jgi:hypothetical protein
MLSAALEAAYAAKPSSISRKLPWEPESLDMNVMVPIGMFVCSSFWAVMIGPIVLVWRWKANSSNDLPDVNLRYYKCLRAIEVYWKCTL